jgi:hypothetical protein
VTTQQIEPLDRIFSILERRSSRRHSSWTQAGAGRHNKTMTLWKELSLSRVPMIKCFPRIQHESRLMKLSLP